MDEMVRVDSYAQIQESLRPFLAEKLKRIYDGLEPYVDGSFGEVAPAHAAAAVAVLRELGRLYRVHEPVRVEAQGFSQAELDAAVAAAVAAARDGWESERRALEAQNRQMILSRVRGA